MAEGDTTSRTSSVDRALVIDDDEWVRNQLASYLKDLGIAEVDLASDGDAGWEAVSKQSYGLIVLDWKLPGLSGIGLFNRIRKSKQHRTTPLLVVSGLLERFDFRLLQEFPCTALMEKPFTKQLFVSKVEDLLREVEWYGQNIALVDSLLAALDGDPSKLARMVRDLLEKAPNPVPLAMIVARRLLRRRLVKEAETVLRGVLKVDDGCVVAMNELGKVMHLTRRHKDALVVLRQASEVSPSNLQRLCLIGEVELNLADAEAARASFAKALELDGEDATAKAGAVVARNMQEIIGDSASGHALGERFASVLNTIGITYVRTGKFTQGIEQYQSAMSFVRSRTDSARVAFNLGLGYLRWGKPDAALPWFQRSVSLGGQAFAKSNDYVQKLMSAEGSVAGDGGISEMEINERAPARAPVGETPLAATEGAKVIPLRLAQPEGDAEADEAIGGVGRTDLNDEAGGGSLPPDDEAAPDLAAAADGEAATRPTRNKDQSDDDINLDLDADSEGSLIAI